MWGDCDLASFAENRLGEVVDPRALEPARRVDWIARAIDGPLWPPSARRHERCYWLLDGGRPAGTLAIATSTLASNLVRLSSVYVFPDARRRGLARRALHQVEHALPAEHGIRLDTCWTWQATLTFYLRAGFWVRGWQHDVDLWRAADMPTPQIHIADAHATLSANGVTLARAERSDGVTRFDDDDAPLRGDGRRTLAVALALAGWPLRSSPDMGLGERIMQWEAYAERQHWLVPRRRRAAP